MKNRISVLLLLVATTLADLFCVFSSCELGVSTNRDIDRQVATAIDYSYSASLDHINGAVISDMKQSEPSEWWSQAKAAYDDKNGNILSSLYTDSLGNGFTLRYAGKDFPISLCETATFEADPKFSTHGIYSVTEDGWTGLDQNQIFIGKSISEKVFSSIIKGSSGFNYKAIIGTELSLSADSQSWETFIVGGVYYDSSGVATNVPGRFFLNSFGNTFFVSKAFADSHSTRNALATLSSKKSSSLKRLQMGHQLAQESSGTYTLLSNTTSAGEKIDLQAWSDSIIVFANKRLSWWRVVLWSLVLLSLLPINFLCALVLGSLAKNPRLHRDLFFFLPVGLLAVTGLPLLFLKRITITLSGSYFVYFLSPNGIMFSVLYAGLAFLLILLALKFSASTSSASFLVSPKKLKKISVDQINI